jgi:catechol 2,3-dioxygenase
MQPPSPVHPPPFNVTRASHVVLTVPDLAASRAFYVDVIGLIVSAEDDTTVYLRGLEEACHHSLVLRKGERAECERIGLRVYTDDDLTRAFTYFSEHGAAPRWVSAPQQGRTLHVADRWGTPLELCATMSVMPRHVTDVGNFRGGGAQRIDHTQVLAPDVEGACAFYMAIGFRLSEYIATDTTDELTGVFLQRKGNPHDLVFVNGAGPRLHHFAYTVPDPGYLLRACDVAGNLGYGKSVERGPGRHGPGHAQFVYFRDPNGHRVELFTTHYQMIDIELEPVRWDSRNKHRTQQWGFPPQRKWVEEATAFCGVEPKPPLVKTDPVTLEKALGVPSR